MEEPILNTVSKEEPTMGALIRGRTEATAETRQWHWQDEVQMMEMPTLY